MYRNQKDFDRWGRFYFDGDGGGGGSSGGLSSEAQAALENRLKKLEGKSDNAALTLAEQLFGENYTLREKVRSMEGKLTPEGATVLTGDDAKAWAEYQALGEPEEVKQGLDQRTQFQGELDGLKREAVLRRVADAAGFKFNVLAERDELARARGKTLVFEVRDVEQEGKKQSVAFVKDGDSEKPLTEYAQSEWADFMPVLVAQGSGQLQAQQQAQQGTRYIGQHSSSGGGGENDLVAAHLKAHNEKAAAAPNPLLKK